MRLSHRLAHSSCAVLSFAHSCRLDHLDRRPLRAVHGPNGSGVLPGTHSPPPPARSQCARCADRSRPLRTFALRHSATPSTRHSSLIYRPRRTVSGHAFWGARQPRPEIWTYSRVVHALRSWVQRAKRDIRRAGRTARPTRQCSMPETRVEAAAASSPQSASASPAFFFWLRSTCGTLTLLCVSHRSSAIESVTTDTRHAAHWRVPCTVSKHKMGRE